ncbi:hypothetical protein H311_03101 [Anncaliia algerae PRA109]|nr:hypothetical protein H311_03101 [Anncaliia algerae PRA109]
MLNDEIKAQRKKEIERIKAGKPVFDLEINSYVLKRIHDASDKRKLLEKWKGSFKVVKKYSNGGYVIKDWTGRKCGINRKDLRKWTRLKQRNSFAGVGEYVG